VWGRSTWGAWIGYSRGSIPSYSCPGVEVGPQRTVHLKRCRRRRLIIPTDWRVARVGPTTRPTTPKHPPGLPLAPCRPDRLSCRRTLFAAVRLSPSARERGRLVFKTIGICSQR
jgi:hypothetical protein